MSCLVPTNEPRMVMRLATTSKSGTGNSPGGRPTSTQVPRLRVIATPCLKAISDGAVMRTPCAPPPVFAFRITAGSDVFALITRSAPTFLA